MYDPMCDSPFCIVNDSDTRPFLANSHVGMYQEKIIIPVIKLISHIAFDRNRDILPEVKRAIGTMNTSERPFAFVSEAAIARIVNVIRL
jgi:hypothetical protein